MPKCKITVVKRMVNPDLIDEYMEEEHRGYDPCDRFEDGQEFMGKSQRTSNRFAVGNRIAVGMNGKAGDLGAAAPKGFSLRKPRRKAPGSFTVDGWNQVPDGFCAYAWADIHREVAVLLSGGSYQPWIKEGTTITCCTDGLRPVVFRIERTE